jgi:hypothetical protein
MKTITLNKKDKAQKLKELKQLETIEKKFKDAKNASNKERIPYKRDRKYIDWKELNDYTD